MTSEIIFAELTPYLQETIKYVASAAAGGLIGNRVDAWFMSLFYYQRKNITKWLSSWEPTAEDLKAISENESLRTVFSKAFHDISQEPFEKKLVFWPKITDSIFRNNEITFDKKQYFTHLFSSLHTYSLKYLGTLYLRAISFDEVFGKNGQHPIEGTVNFEYYMGQMQCLSAGLTKMENSISSFVLTPFGKEFIDFIADHSKNRLEDLVNITS